MTARKIHTRPVLSACGLLLAAIIMLAGGLSQPGRAGSGGKKVVFIRANFKPDPGSIMVDHFKAALRKRGYEEGRNIEYVDISIRGTDREEARKALDQVDRQLDRTDLVVTSGWISIEIRNRLAASGIPQIFSPVLREEALTMLPSLTEPTGTNLTGIYLNYPPENILRLARLILPNIRRYAYVFDANIPTDRYLREAYDRLPEDRRLGIDIHFLDLAGGTKQVLDQMKTLRIEAFGGLIGAYKNRKELAGSGLPMITALLMDIDRDEVGRRIRENNILAGLYDPMDYCGQQAGQMAADILDGRQAAAATVPRPARHLSFLNMVSAGRNQIHIPFAALEAVDLVIK